VSTQNPEDMWWEHPSVPDGPGIEIFDYMLDERDERRVTKAELLGVFKIFHAELEKHSGWKASPRVRTGGEQ